MRFEASAAITTSVAQRRSADWLDNEPHRSCSQACRVPWPPPPRTPAGQQAAPRLPERRRLNLRLRIGPDARWAGSSKPCDTSAEDPVREGELAASWAPRHHLPRSRRRLAVTSRVATEPHRATVAARPCRAWNGRPGAGLYPNRGRARGQGARKGDRPWTCRASSTRRIPGASRGDGRLDTAGRAIPDPVPRPTKPTPSSDPDRTQGRRGVAHARAGARGPFLSKEVLPWAPVPSGSACRTSA